MSNGVPIKVLHEAEGHIITLESSMGVVYRGKLVVAEDNMNCHMTGVTATSTDGKMYYIDSLFIRGSKVRFIILPEMLKNAPMFKTSRGLPGTRGRGALMRNERAATGRGLPAYYKSNRPSC